MLRVLGVISITMSTPDTVALDHLPQESGKSHTRLFAAASSEAIILFLPSILFGIILALKEATAI